MRLRDINEKNYLEIRADPEVIKDIIYSINHSNANTLLESMREAKIEVKNE